MNLKGTLIPIGGNENKGINIKERYKMEFIEESILAKVVKESGGSDAKIVVIPTASSIPEKVGDGYLRAFGQLNCTNVDILDIRSREQSESPKSIALIKEADCVMFSGGNQSNITEKIGGTSIHEILVHRLQHESFVVAGTSAGAMCMSHNMISGGAKKETFAKGTVRLKTGLGFVEGFIIDSHFLRRSRFGRLAEAVARYPNRIGIGLAEDTGLIIKNGINFEVIGSGMVILVDPGELLYNTEKIVGKGELMSLVNLKTHIMARGDSFVIKNKGIEKLTIKALS